MNKITLEKVKQLLRDVYQDIERECTKDTQLVSLETIKKVLRAYGIKEKEL